MKCIEMLRVLNTRLSFLMTDLRSSEFAHVQKPVTFINMLKAKLTREEICSVLGVMNQMKEKIVSGSSLALSDFGYTHISLGGIVFVLQALYQGTPSEDTSIEQRTYTRSSKENCNYNFLYILGMVLKKDDRWIQANTEHVQCLIDEHWKELKGLSDFSEIEIYTLFQDTQCGSGAHAGFTQTPF
jgi:hypothetical protein